MTRSTQRASLLALAGFASAIITMFTGTFSAGLSLFYPGLVFGAAIAAVFVLHGRVRSLFKPAAFVAASTAAYPISVFSAVLISELFKSGSQGGPMMGSIPYPLVFTGGCIGAFIILFAAFVLFGPPNIDWTHLGRPFLWSAMGGVLGVIGFFITYGLRGPSVTAYALEVLWPTGVALSIAFVVGPEQALASPPPEPGRPSTALRVIATLFFGAILAFFGWQISREHQRARVIAQKENGRRQMVAETPSIGDLPPLSAMTPEQALIKEDIGGFFAKTPRVQRIPARPALRDFPPSPPSVTMTLTYASPIIAQPEGFGAIVVTVEQFPNSAWAQYKAKYPSASSSTVADHFTVTTKFENRIYMDHSPWPPNQSGSTFFYWPSGAVVVTIRYEGNRINEELLKRYLEKYPSTL